MPATDGSALLLLDLQEGLCRGPLGAGSGLAAEVERRGVLDRAARALAAARSAAMTVAHVCVRFDPGYARRTNRSARFALFEEKGLLGEGAADAEICAEVAPAAGEPVLVKGCVDPFVGTGLDAFLRVHGATELYLCGVATNFVVESAARHAGDSGYRVTVLEDACASYDEEMHRFAIERTLPTFATIATTGALAAAAEAAR